MPVGGTPPPSLWQLSSGEEVLRVTAQGEFIWNERADELIASGYYDQYPSRRYVLMALKTLTDIAETDLTGCDLPVAGHMAHGLIGKARAALRQEQPK